MRRSTPTVPGVVFSLLLVACWTGLSVPATGRTLQVGEGRQFRTPSEAIGQAAAGDVISIDPGTYFDCAVVRQPNLTISGAGAGVILTDKTCEGKAILVVRGPDLTVRDLRLARARVEDGNGAGIRLEAPDLRLERVEFDNDQVGLLAADGGGTIRIDDCRFAGGGAGGESPLFAVMVGRAALLHVARSRFEGVAGGQIATAADRTEIIGNTVGTGAGDLPAPAIQATDGALVVEDNTFIVGPHAPRRGAAVALWDDANGALRSNRLENQSGQEIALLLDWSWGTPTLAGNQVGPSDRLSTSQGLLRHRISTFLRTAKAVLKRMAHDLKGMLHWLA